MNLHLTEPNALIVTLSATLVISSASPSAVAGNKGKAQMNVLFLISDDLRAELGITGSQMAKTPNLDQLARQGVCFQHAYCQYPLCCPSRSSVLTGRRPVTSGLYSNREWFGATWPEWVSLPRYFKMNGYTVLRSGKVFHEGIDDTEAWSEGGEPRIFANPINLKPPSSLTPDEIAAYYPVRLPKLSPGAGDNNPRSDRWKALVGKEADELGDNKVAEKAIELIKQSTHGGQPFFLACGFSKPHSPLMAPKRFFDLYDADKLILPPDFASLPMVPVGFPAGSIRRNNADLFINRTASAGEARDMIRAYLACVSYVDWNAGRVIAELDRQGLRENTIIVFWGDNGYQLGEKGKWSKAGSLWEQGARVPLIIYDPRAKGNGQNCIRIVELLDLYPTLADLCGLPFPEGAEGVSLRPLLDNPGAAWDRPAYTVWNENGKGITGVVVRTERWRYAEFFGMGAGAFLTDAVNDPYEVRNLVNLSEYGTTVADLQKLARAYVAGKTELPPPLK